MKRRSIYFTISATCIHSAERNSSETSILNNVDESTCVNMYGKSKDRKTVITKLQVNKTCVTGSDVSEAHVNLSIQQTTSS